MTRIYALIFATALLLSAQPSCSWFQKHPVIPAVVTCSGQTIPLPLVEQIYGDVMSENWVDLAANVIPLLKDGWADAICIMNYLHTSNPETAPHIEKLKGAHLELRGESACRTPAIDYKANPGDRLPGASPASEGAPRVSLAGPKGFTYAGETVSAAAARCDRECGERDAIGSPGEDCICQRKINGKSWWVEAR